MKNKLIQNYVVTRNNIPPQGCFCRCDYGCVRVRERIAVRDTQTRTQQNHRIARNSCHVAYSTLCFYLATRRHKLNRNHHLYRGETARKFSSTFRAQKNDTSFLAALVRSRFGDDGCDKTAKRFLFRVCAKMEQNRRLELCRQIFCLALWRVTKLGDRR